MVRTATHHTLLLRLQVPDDRLQVESGGSGCLRVQGIDIACASLTLSPRQLMQCCMHAQPSDVQHDLTSCARRCPATGCRRQRQRYWRPAGTARRRASQPTGTAFPCSCWATCACRACRTAPSWPWCVQLRHPPWAGGHLGFFQAIDCCVYHALSGMLQVSRTASCLAAGLPCGLLSLRPCPVVLRPRSAASALSMAQLAQAGPALTVSAEASWLHQSST